jgi:hypothetical protein
VRRECRLEDFLLIYNSIGKSNSVCCTASRESAFALSSSKGCSKGRGRKIAKVAMARKLATVGCVAVQVIAFGVAGCAFLAGVRHD